MQSTGPEIVEPPQSPSTPPSGEALVPAPAGDAGAATLPPAEAVPAASAASPGIDFTDPIVQQQVREFMRAENDAAEQKRQAAEQAAQRPQSRLHALIHHDLGLEAPFTDAPGVALQNKAARVLARITGWEGATDDPRRAQQLQLGDEQMMDLRREAQAHRYILNQQASAAAKKPAPATPDGARATTLATLSGETAMAIIKDRWPSVHSALASGRLSNEKLVSMAGLDWSQGEDKAFDQLRDWLPGLDALLTTPTAGTPVAAPAPGITPPPSTPTGAPGESPGYSAATPGVHMSEADYNAMVNEKVRRRVQKNSPPN